MIVTIFRDLLKTTDVPYHVAIDKVIDRIRIGKSKDKIELIRNGDKEIKKKLPCILFSGTFSERNANGLIDHSGLMVLDFDNIPALDYEKVNENLKSNPFCFCTFRSPSGDGLKVVIKIDKCDKARHSKIFEQFSLDYSYDYLDKSGSDLSRVCFESYDPEIYVNKDCDTYNPIIIDKGYKIKDRVPLIPITDNDIIINKIMEWNWSKDFREGERNAFVFDVASAFCEYGVDQMNAEYYIENNIIHGDFSQSEMVNTIKSAYRSRQFNCRYFENYEKINKIAIDIPKGVDVVTKKYNIDSQIFDEIKSNDEHLDFWSQDDKGKVSINPMFYKRFLERNGFKKYFPEGAQRPIFVSINSNKVSETSVEKIKDFVLNYLEQRSEFDVWSYCAKYTTLFSDNFLLMLESVELMMLKDTSKKSFIAFQNGILEVTKNNTNMIDFIDVDGYIWESQIIERSFKIIKENNNDYKVFINNISNSNPLAIECTIGYLLCTHKDKMNNRAIILNDEVISENPEGGTGKGLFIQGIANIRKVSILDGKAFDDKKSFPYQTVSAETNVLVFDDVKKNFDFESKFSLVTEGMTLERKNKDAIKLKVEDSPKIVISTNYAIKGEGNSHNRRRHEIEFAQYYGKDITPISEFNRQLFDDWELSDFNKFDNYMVECLQKYLNNGLIEQNAKNIHLRKFIAETSMEFFDWINDRQNLTLNVRHDKIEVYNRFVEDYPDFKKWLQRKTFSVWIKKYSSYRSFEYTDGRTPNRWFSIGDGGQVVETKYDWLND